MTRIADTSFTRRHPLLWGLFLGLALGANVVSAATPRASFGSALITSADNRISVTRVPVINSAGAVSYKDVTINFTVDTAGTLTAGATTINASPNLVTSGFQAGNYRDARGNTYKVTGPSVIPGTTRTMWSLVFVSGPDATQLSMSWVTGPITGHPNQSSLTVRNITSTAYSWGIIGDAKYLSSNFPFYGWGNGAYVVGAAQAGTQLILNAFSNLDNIVDDSVSLQKY